MFQPILHDPAWIAAQIDNEVIDIFGLTVKSVKFRGVRFDIDIFKAANLDQGVIANRVNRPQNILFKGFARRVAIRKLGAVLLQIGASLPGIKALRLAVLEDLNPGIFSRIVLGFRSKAEFRRVVIFVLDTWADGGEMSQKRIPGKSITEFPIEVRIGLRISECRIGDMNGLAHRGQTLAPLIGDIRQRKARFQHVKPGGKIPFRRLAADKAAFRLNGYHASRNKENTAEKDHSYPLCYPRVAFLAHGFLPLYLGYISDKRKARSKKSGLTLHSAPEMTNYLPQSQVSNSM